MNIYDVLDKLSISYEEITHDAVKTVKEAKEIENSYNIINEILKSDSL